MSLIPSTAEHAKKRMDRASTVEGARGGFDHNLVGAEADGELCESDFDVCFPRHN